MKRVEVYLLTHGPAFQSFTYCAPEGLHIRTGDIVAVPFRNRLEAGVAAAVQVSPEPPQAAIKPILGRVTTPIAASSQLSFGAWLLLLAELYLCTPGEMLSQLLWGSVSQRVVLTLSGGPAPPPRGLESKAEAARLLLGRGGRRITSSLLSKLQSTMAFWELSELIVSGALVVSGVISLTPQHPPAASPARLQPGLFASRQSPFQLDPHFALSQRAAHGLSEVGSSSGSLEAPTEVLVFSWPELCSPRGLSALVADATGNILLLLPTQALMDQLTKAIPRRLRQRTFVLKPDLKAAELEELARRLRERTPLFVIGKRSAHFLMYHATFARVIVVDPTAETFRSEQYPCYDTLIDCLLTGATGGPIITLIPFTPLPLGLPHPLRNHQTVALRGAPGDRIEQLVELIGTQAEAGKQLLVYNNALGTGQEVFCAECSQQIGCTRCGRQLFVHGDQEGLFCPRCHHLESVVSCPSCGSRQLGVEVIGVEGLARRVRQWLRKSQRRPTPRVGALDAERRKRIRVPNLSRTDVLIGTSTLFAPLKFYRPRTVIHVAQDLWRPSPGGFPEVAVINEMARLTSLYAGRIERTIVAAPEALADSLAAQLGADADHTQRELNAVRKQYGLPPYNTVVRFTLYGHREKAVSEFADEMAGQLQFSQQVLRWEQSRVLPRGRNAGFLLRGQVTLERFSPGIFHDLRRRAKGKRLDIVFSPQYY